MPISASEITPALIINILLKRRWFLIIPFCISMIVGTYFVFTLPKIFSAKTSILVEPQRVPRNYVQSLVSIDINARISTISQQILSRTNLEKIIKEFRLFPDQESKNMFLEDKVSNVRKRISVKVTKARRGADAFSISFKGKEPKKVMKVANALATYFINENLKVRESQAVGTSDFLDDERKAMKKRLVKVEQALREYRKKYMGELPEQLETNLRILERLQAQVSERQQTLNDTKKRLIELKDRFSMAQDIQASRGAIQPETEALSILEQMKQQLVNLQSRYTERHPDIIRLKRIIAEHETKTENISENNSGESSASQPMDRQKLMKLAYMNQTKEIKGEIKTLTEELSELQNQINIHEKRVESTPKREQELMSLRRDYQNIQSAYSSLLSRKLEAEIAVNMERKQKGERFRILDSARLPQKPISPDMKRLFMLAMAAGLGIGGGLIFLLEYFNTSFRMPEDVESYLGLSVLATVPEIYQSKDLKKNRLHQALSIFSIMIAFILFAGFAVLTLKGVDQTLGLIRKFVKI